jgi:uncharacterized protein YjbI with pentapeptide repeats
MNVTRKRLKSPRLNGTVLQGWLPQPLMDETGLQDVLVSGSNLMSVAVRHLEIDRCLLDTVAFCNASLPHLTVRDTKIETSDLANSSCTDSFFGRVQICNSRLVGWNVTGSSFRDVLLLSSNCELAYFRFTKMHCVDFVECNLREADFHRADLRSVVFLRCNLRGAQLGGCNLNGTDFRGSDIKDIKLNSEDLKGAIIDPIQASYVAGLLGVRIMPANEDN